MGHEAETEKVILLVHSNWAELTLTIQLKKPSTKPYKQAFETKRKGFGVLELKRLNYL